MNGRFFRGVRDFWRKFRDLGDKEFRHAYVAEQIRIGLPHQIRALREEEERKWTQAELGKRAGKPQNVISRIENLNYGKLSITTLLELAQAFDVALLIKFVPFSRFIQEFDDVSSQSLASASYEAEHKYFQKIQKEAETTAAVKVVTRRNLLCQNKSALDTIEFILESKANPAFGSQRSQMVN